MSFRAPRAKNCAFCGESLDNDLRVVVGKIKADWTLHVVGWHMPKGAGIDTPSCYDQDEEIADLVVSDTKPLAESLAAMVTIRKRGPGRVLRAKILMTTDHVSHGRAMRRARKTKRKQR